MKKSTKSVALVLSAMMLLPVVSGCGNSQESETGSTVSAETASSKTSEATSSETSEGKPVLKHLIGSISTDPNKGYLKSRLQELTGYEVEYEMLPKENSLDALNLKLASGINYDIITTGADITSRATMDKLARQGALTQLDDLIKEYGPNVEQSVNQVCWDMTMVDGKKYMIANIDPGSTPKGNFWCPFIVREDLCEKLDMKFPDTLDGFVEFLTAVKEQDPAGKGDQNIPFTIFPGSDLSVIRSAFGIYHG